jgi:DNA-binding response OmpR family regulator
VGFVCLVAPDKGSALLLFEREHPSLVLSDITLPDGDGFEIVGCVRQNSPNTPVVLMTAYHSSTAERDALDAGASAYLRKPFANSKLTSTIESLIGRPISSSG